LNEKLAMFLMCFQFPLISHKIIPWSLLIAGAIFSIKQNNRHDGANCLRREKNQFTDGGYLQGNLIMVLQAHNYPPRRLVIV
jgi:hypothetical protein